MHIAMRNGSIVHGKQAASAALPKRKNESRNSDAQLSDLGYLRLLGERVRRERMRLQLTRKNLAQKSGVSERYLAQLEAGKGNISILLLRQVSQALELPLESLVLDSAQEDGELLRAIEILKRLTPDQLRHAQRELHERYSAREKTARQERVALIGLRGAGKSTLGALLAEKLDVPFLELDRLVEHESGLTLSAIFDLYGPAGFHRYERECLDRLLGRYGRFVLAAGGSLVTEEATFDVLLHSCYTVWLRARPEDHMNRVVAQGDRRPMAASSQAMSDLRRILSSREPLYAKADLTVETSGKSMQQSLQELLKAIAEAKKESEAAAL